jgi:mono/diheme cytochrome c family protein
MNTTGILGLGAALLVAVSANTGHPQAAGQEASAAPSSQRAVLDRYCVSCHNPRMKTGGLTLDPATMDVSSVADRAETWEKVVRKMRSEVMPPVGRPRPDKAAHDAFVSWLETQLDRSAAANPNPGRKEALHRLSRAEYQNVIRDLLEIEIDVSELLPPDDTGYGFDNIAGVLTVTPTLLEQYLRAAGKVSGLATGALPKSPTADTYRNRSDLPQLGQMEGLPPGSRGGMLVRHNFPADAEYVITAAIGGTRDPHQLEITLDKKQVQLTPAAALPRKVEVRVPVTAGPHEVGVTFVKRSFAKPDDTVMEPYVRPYPEQASVPIVESVTVLGPYNATSPRPANPTPSRQRIFVCRPDSVADQVPCASTILKTIARRAYRRPVTPADLQPLLKFFGEGERDGGFDAGIETALRAILVSPEFLFRVERDPATATPSAVYKLTSLELASRLSFFLWSSVPDDELLDVASRGELTRPAVLEKQVRRMLSDRRAQALVKNFAGQWLLLRTVPATQPSEYQFPDFDESLRQSFIRETELFFESIVREDRSLLDLVNADYTFVNERLARHYGIPKVYGNQYRRVALTDGMRGGLLGQGSLLLATSHPTSTAPVLRGKWILENLLGTPPPPPPPDIPALKLKNKEGRALSMREQMVQHRENPACASCHAFMDPLGFALEPFDAVGRLRTADENNNPIDATGAFPDGTKFDGPKQLREALTARADLVMTVVTEKLLIYALGRGVEYYDAPTVRRIVRAAAANNYRFSTVIFGIVNSTPFQMRRAQS